jgi:hypothetical protein
MSTSRHAAPSVVFVSFAKRTTTNKDQFGIGIGPRQLLKKQMIAEAIKKSTMEA